MVEGAAVQKERKYAKEAKELCVICSGFWILSYVWLMLLGILVGNDRLLELLRALGILLEATAVVSLQWFGGSVYLRPFQMASTLKLVRPSCRIGMSRDSFMSKPSCVLKFACTIAVPVILFHIIEFGLFQIVVTVFKVLAQESD